MQPPKIIRQLGKKIIPRKILNYFISKAGYTPVSVRTDLNSKTSFGSDVDKIKRINAPQIQLGITQTRMSKQEGHSPKKLLAGNISFPWLVKALTDSGETRGFFYHNMKDAKPSLCYSETEAVRIANALIDLAIKYDLQLWDSSTGKYRRVEFDEPFVRLISIATVTNIRVAYAEKRCNFRMEKWIWHDGVLVAPRSNIYTRKIYIKDNAAAVNFLNTPGAPLEGLFSYPHENSQNFPVDVVYTWVNGDDKNWQDAYREHAVVTTEKSEHETNGSILADPAIFDRYASRDELRYSIRSVLQYAPWVRKIFIVSNCAPPSWLDLNSEKIQWVDHSEILPVECLPTFNSHAIESSLHKIESLSEHFIYFNDDLFLLKSVSCDEFFTTNGIPRVRLEPYGMVHGNVNESDPDFLNAARNVQKLLQKKFGLTASQLHTHTPTVALKSVLIRAEKQFKSHYNRTRKAKTRTPQDISPTSFLSPHYHLMSGNAVTRDPDYTLIKLSGNYKQVLDKLRDAVVNDTKRPSLICINDGGGSTSDEDWNRYIENFMKDTFFVPSSVEATVPNGFLQ